MCCTGASRDAAGAGGLWGLLQGRALPPPDRAIIVARSSEETSWLHVRFGNIPSVVYQTVANLTERRERCPPGVACCGSFIARSVPAPAALKALSIAAAALRGHDAGEVVRS